MNTYLVDGYELKYKQERPDMYTITLLQIENKFEIAKIYYVVYGNELYISLIMVEEEYRGQGIGTYLIFILIEYYINFHNKSNDCSEKVIALEDMSDRPWKKDNIYIKLGFKYSDEEPFPDMLAYVKDVYNDKNISQFNTKYRKTNGIFKKV